MIFFTNNKDLIKNVQTVLSGETSINTTYLFDNLVFNLFHVSKHDNIFSI